MKLFSMHLLQNIVLFSMHKYSKHNKPEDKFRLQQDSNPCLPKSSGVPQPTELKRHLLRSGHLLKGSSIP